MIQLVKVELSPIDAERFKKFQQNYWLFEALEQKGVLDMQFGKCTLNIAHGEIQNIVKEEMVWKK